MPQVDQDIGSGLASVCVEHTDIEVDRDTGLALAHVLSKGVGLRPDVRPSSNLWDKYAGVVLNRWVVRRFLVNCDIAIPCDEMAFSHGPLLARSSESAS